MEQWEREYVDGLLGALREMAERPGYASGPARTALSRVGTLEQARARYVRNMNGGPGHD